MTCSFGCPEQKCPAADQTRYERHSNDEINQWPPATICKLYYCLFNSIIHDSARFFYRLSNQTFVCFNQPLIHIYSDNGNTTKH